MKGIPNGEGKIRRAVHARDGWRCRYCGVQTSYRQKNKPYSRTADHVIPRSKGGRTTVANLVTCCKQCNELKKSHTLAELGWTMRPKPTWSQEQVTQWRRKTLAFTCYHCDRQPSVHGTPPHHGGPRPCPTGGTIYLAMAHYVVLKRKGLLPDAPALS